MPQSGPPPEPSVPVQTADGSFTFWHPGYREHYHAREGARSEAELKYLAPSGLADRLASREPVRLLDLGFGLGVNAGAALDLARRLNGHLWIESLENDPVALERAAALRDEPWLHALAEQGHWQEGDLRIDLYMGDAREGLRRCQPGVDLVFHDPFSPQKNPECWTLEVFQMEFALLHPGGVLLTYSEACAVRGGLLQAGFLLGLLPGHGGHKNGTIAHRPPACPLHPLPPALMELLVHSPRGRPYRDPSLCADRRTILREWQCAGPA